jgi:filamentous hemagglutinin family protein
MEAPDSIKSQESKACRVIGAAAGVFTVLVLLSWGGASPAHAGNVLGNLAHPGTVPLSPAETAQALQNAAARNAAATNTILRTNNGQVNLSVLKDPNAIPSLVLKSFNVGGKTYVINRNGIIFGGSSQVNTHELTVAAMDATSNGTSEPAKRLKQRPKKDDSSIVTVRVLRFGE